MCQVSSIDLVICILVFHDPTKMSMYFIYPLVGRRSLRPTRGIMSEVASLAPTYKTRQDKTRQDKARQEHVGGRSARSDLQENENTTDGFAIQIHISPGRWG